MAVFIAVLKRDGDAGYTASFPDFPQCAVGGPTVEYVMAKAREVLAMQIERLIEANQRIAIPTAAEAIELGDGLLLAAIDVPDDLRMAHVEFEIPALSLAWIDSFARRRGLTHAALLVEAVKRWELEEAMPRDRRAGLLDAPTLFDFANPLDLRVEAIAAPIDPTIRSAAPEAPRDNFEANADDITAELARLLEQSAEPPLTEETASRRGRPANKPE